MFVQVIKGRTRDAEGIRRRNEAWRKEVRPGATGFLGSTAGVAADGTFIAIARFADEASARANSERPEQSAWWAETAKLFEGEPSFRESSDVSLLFDGGSDQAGFVQVMEGRVTDRAKLESMESEELLGKLRAARPDLIGSLRVWFPEGAFVDTAYFTNEADARKGESSGEFSGPQQELGSLFAEMTFVDLGDPMFSGP